MELCPHVHMGYSHGKATVCIVVVAQLPRLRETLMTVLKVLS